MDKGILRSLANCSDTRFLEEAGHAIQQAQARVEFLDFLTEIRLNPQLDLKDLTRQIVFERKFETSTTGKRTELVFAYEDSKTPLTATQHFFKVIHIDQDQLEEAETKLTLFLGRRTVDTSQELRKVSQSKQRRVYRRKKLVLSNGLERELEDEIIRAYMDEASVPLALFVRLAQIALVRRGLMNVATQLSKFLRLVDEVLPSDESMVNSRHASVGLGSYHKHSSFLDQVRGLFPQHLDYASHEEIQRVLEDDSSGDEGHVGDLMNTDGEDDDGDEPDSSDLDFVVEDGESDLGDDGNRREGDESDTGNSSNCADSSDSSADSSDSSAESSDRQSQDSTSGEDEPQELSLSIQNGRDSSDGGEVIRRRYLPSPDSTHGKSNGSSHRRRTKPAKRKIRRVTGAEVPPAPTPVKSPLPKASKKRRLKRRLRLDDSSDENSSPSPSPQSHSSPKFRGSPPTKKAKHDRLARRGDDLLSNDDQNPEASAAPPPRQSRPIPRMSTWTSSTLAGLLEDQKKVHNQ